MALTLDDARTLVWKYLVSALPRHNDAGHLGIVAVDRAVANRAAETREVASSTRIHGSRLLHR
jgi:hypothetical protein